MSIIVDLLHQIRAEKKNKDLYIETLAERTKMTIQASISDYSIMRAEQNTMLSRQTTVLCLTITIAGVLFGIGYNLLSGEGLSGTAINKYPLLQFCLFSVIIPCIFMFLGAIWIDCAYRQQRLCAYLYSVEERVNNLLLDTADINKAALYWEHFASLDSKKRKHFRPNQLYYYFCLALYIFFPILSFLFNIIVLQVGIEKWFLIIIFVYVLYLVFIFSYVIAILQIHPYLDKKTRKRRKGKRNETEN